MSLSVFDNQPILENNRVQLIPLQTEHATDLFSISEKDIWKYMPVKIRTLTDMQNWVDQAISLRKKKTALPFVVLDKNTNQLVGSTRLYDIHLYNRSCELGGTWYQKKHQRTYVNTDCKKLLLQFGFEKMNFVRIQIKTDERNITSQNAISRIGATKEGLIRNERILEDGYIRNAFLYSIIQEEWPQVKQALDHKINSYS